MDTEVYSKLIVKLLQISGIEDYTVRTSLILNIPNHQSLTRTNSDTFADIIFIVNGLANMHLLDGRWALLAFIENVLARVSGTTLSSELRELQQILEAEQRAKDNPANDGARQEKTKIPREEWSDVPQQGFSFSQSNDPNDLPEMLVLRQCKAMLENIWSTLAFGVDLRKIRERNINMFETDLRRILLEMQKIPDAQFSLMGSMPSVRMHVTSAIDKLFVASYYEKKSTPKEMQLFLQEIRLCQEYVYNALVECKRMLGEEN